MWQIDGDKIVYFLDEGKRRPMKNVNTLLSLGLDFDMVMKCETEEMYSVPMGDILYDKNGVNYLKHRSS